MNEWMNEKKNNNEKRLNIAKNRIEVLQPVIPNSRNKSKASFIFNDANYFFHGLLVLFSFWSGSKRAMLRKSLERGNFNG